MTATRQLRTPASNARARYIDLGGAADHLFRFGAPLDLAYEYFCDVPAVFSLLPDALDCFAYGPDRYRLVVGATDGHGHSMAAIFDLEAHHDPCNVIRLVPASDGPPYNMAGLVFSGTLAAQAVFRPAQGDTSTVDYHVEIDMAIPIPNALHMMPLSFLQKLGERTMEYKMTQMIDGFARSIDSDFHGWVTGGVS